MKTLLTLLLIAAAAFGQTATISDTIRTPFGGTFSGTVTVSLNSPALAQPLYSGNVTLSGWTQTVTVTSGVFTLTLYTNDQITPGGTSYTATFAPTSGSGWKETWIVPTGATTIREIRSTTVPSPSVRFNPSQITQAGATLGQGLRWNGSIWAPAAVLTDPMTTTGDLITRSGSNAVRVGIGSTNQVLTVSGGMPVWASGITGNASTASALAANGTNCSAGSFPLGVDASGNAEGCTAAVTASTGLSDSSDIVRGGAALTTPGSVPFVTAAGVLGQSGNLFWDNANGRLGVGTNAPAVPFHVARADTSQLLVSGTTRAFRVTTNSTEAVLAGVDQTGFASFQPLMIQATRLAFNSGAGEIARFAATTGNLLLGTTTDDGSNRLQVAGNMRMAANTPKLIMRDTATGTADFEFQASGNILNINRAGVAVLGTIDYLNGSFTWYNQTPTTGSTSLVVRAGAGQGGNNLQTWQNAAGAALAVVTSNGAFETKGGYLAVQNSAGSTNFMAFTANGDYASSVLTRWSSTTDANGTKDLSLSRASANTLQVGDGSANSNGTILARIYTWANGTEGTCDATLRGRVVMVQGGAGVADTFRVCRKDAANVYAWTALY